MRVLNLTWSAILMAGFVFGALIVVAWQEAEPASRDTGTSVVVPKLSMKAAAGNVAFDKNCGQCHGANGIGTDKGPPLIHRVYHPGHHADGAFALAAKRGVRQHHWRFGNMPPQPQVSDLEIKRIILYIRAVQRANGIGFKRDLQQ